MKVEFYGVRGSTPSPGAEYIKYGGNTACVHIELNDGTDIILDAGTGIKNLGQKLIKKQTDIHLLLTHNHWDHIQGFPFFAPIYQANRNIFITPGQTNLPQQDAILQQMSGSYFPVDYKDLPSNIKICTLPEATESWRINQAVITRKPMNHPGGGSAFQIHADGAKVAYITDNELYPPYKKQTDFQQWVEFAYQSDLVIHDAQYLLTDMPAKAGWGHSVAEEAVKLAMACKTKRLALYSHDHTRTDKEIELIEQHSQELIELINAPIQVFGAAEGLVLKLNL